MRTAVTTTIERPELRLVVLSRRPADISRFLRVSAAIYGEDACWVAPLWQDMQSLFDERNPFFEHAELSLWVATLGGRDVGRIAAIVDRTLEGSSHQGTAYFGFFEAIESYEVSHALFEAATAWARQKGLQRLLGPMNPSPNHECGLLVSGFDRSPVVMMAYNPSYYAELIQAEGFAQAKDLLAFYIDLAQCPMERVGRIVTRFRKREPGILIRPIKRRTLHQDLPKVQDVYNQAWSENWGFTPMTDAEIRFLAERLKPLLTEGLVWIAETPGEPVGILLAVPDFNEAIKPLRGRLLTPKLCRFLMYWLGLKRPSMVRVIALGVKDRFRGRGIESVMLAHALQVGCRLGFQAAEASWVLDDNIKSRRIIEVFGGRQYKTYRLYQRGV